MVIEWCISFWGERHAKEFSDVTLACKDGQVREAHKVILACEEGVYLKSRQGKEQLNKNVHLE